jgi:RNA polymerase sigma factor (sigma-70 family)
MRSADAQSAVFTEYAKLCVRVKARQLSRRSEFRRSDVDDLEQELWLRLLKEAPRFDVGRGSLNTFIDRVVNTAGGMIVRHPYRQKRAAGQKALSLEGTKVSFGDAKKPLVQLLTEADMARRTATMVADKIARRQDAEAIAYALGAMPDEVRNVCRQVMGGSISSAARDLGVSRHQIREALQAARPYFERAGFGG